MNSRAKTSDMALNARPREGGLPLVPRRSADVAVAEYGAGRSPWILVVEDQEDVRRMMATALEIEGYRVDEAANAQDGLRRLRARHYDLVREQPAAIVGHEQFQRVHHRHIFTAGRG